METRAGFRKRHGTRSQFPKQGPVCYKDRPVLPAFQEDLEKAYQDGVASGTWEPVQFNDYGTPVVPIKKTQLPGQTKATMRVCGTTWLQSTSS